MSVTSQNPVVIVPGVLFWDGLYEVMRDALSRYLPAEKIEIAPVSLLDWVGFPPSPERSTNRVMTAIDRSVRSLRIKFPEEQVTIVAHSGGGTVAMIYLLEKRFQGDEYHPGDSVGKLVTLGTPFHTHEHYAKIKTDFIFRHLDSDFFLRKEVVSIVSDQYRGDLQGSLIEKMCYMFYRSVTEDGHAAGDGIVPADSCYLEGARNVTIPHVEHLPTPHTRWYGTKEGVDQWIQWL
ncbi:MAG: alpha/beta fold hydrolase [Chlorobi bacterium]|nr:alpha/beta fold hydrolase [Chlorobiota bacterium]